MQQEIRYICQRAANAIISEVGSYRVSTDALHGINQFLDEFLVRLLTHAQSLDLSQIKASVFHLLPSTLGKNAIVEAELEVKTFTETEVIDYDMYEKMRNLGSPSFPLKQCLPLLRDKCFEFCTLADKDDQRSWLPQQQQDIIVISPIVAIYVTTVLEHMAEYILTAVAMTAETEDTDYVRIKELFLALIDDMQVGLVFQNMDLRDKMEKRSFPHGYVSRSSMLLPPTTSVRQDHPRNSSNSMNPGSNFLGDIAFDDLELNYDDDEDTSVQHQRSSRTHTSLSNYSITSNNNRQRPLSMMTNSTSQTSFSGSSSNKKAYKVFKNDHTSPLVYSQPSAYDPDSSTMNFEDLIRSGNTMRVSLTPHRLKSIEVKDQMVDEPAPEKPTWKRRSSSVPRMSTSSSSSRPQTPTLPHPQHHRSPSPLVTATPTNDSVLNDYIQPLSHKTKTMADHRFEQREVSKPPLSATTTSSSSKSIEKSLPTPTSSTSSRQSKHHAPVFAVIKTSSLSLSESTTSSTTTITSDDTSKKTPVLAIEKVKSSPTATTSSTTSMSSPTPTTAKPTNGITTTTQPPILRRGSLSNRKSRENLRRQREKEAKASTTEPKIDSTFTTTTKRRDSSASSNSSKQQQKTARPSKSTPDLTEQHQSSSDSLDSLKSDTTKQDPSPQRPSIYVAKRASMAGTSRRQSLHESYAITVTEPVTATISKDTTPLTPTPRSHSATAAGTVGNTIKQLDQVVKQKSSASSIQSYSRKASTTSLASNDSADTTLYVPPKAASRKSAVLDRVLQFERAYSLDDSTSQQRRASSYIPRRERFMYLQRDPNALEKKSTTSTMAASSSTTSVVRPGTSAAIAAAAARFASGVSMAIQTDPAPTPIPPSLTVTDDAGNNSLLHHTSSLAATLSKQNDGDDDDDLVSEHGVVDGDEEWFLPEDEWEDVHEQENAVAEWLLGEA